MAEIEVKKRYMACSKCRGTAFEIYREELIHERTPNEILEFEIDLGDLEVPGTTRIRCLGCGLENSTIAIFENPKRSAKLPMKASHTELVTDEKTNEELKILLKKLKKSD